MCLREQLITVYICDVFNNYRFTWATAQLVFSIPLSVANDTPYTLSEAEGEEARHLELGELGTQEDEMESEVEWRRQRHERQLFLRQMVGIMIICCLNHVLIMFEI